MKENEELRSNISELQRALNELHKQYDSSDQRIREYETRVALFSSEIERLNNIIRERITENEELKRRLAAL